MLEPYGDQRQIKDGTLILYFCIFARAANAKYGSLLNTGVVLACSMCPLPELNNKGERCLAGYTVWEVSKQWVPGNSLFQQVEQCSASRPVQYWLYNSSHKRRYMAWSHGWLHALIGVIASTCAGSARAPLSSYYLPRRYEAVANVVAA